MAVTVYTRDRVPMDALREQQIFTRLFTENAILSGGTIKSGTAFNVTRTPGWYVIKGVLIHDDALSTDWMDLATVEPAYGGDRIYLFWVKFDPLTDTEPTFGVFSLPTDTVEVAGIFNDDTYLVTCIVRLDNSAASAADGVYRRFDLRMDEDAWRKASVDGYVLYFDTVKYEQTSAGGEGGGQHRLRWGQMQLAGERLGWIYNIEGAAVGPAEVGPHGSSLAWELTFPNWDFGFIFVRAAREEPVDDGVTTSQTTELAFVGVSGATGSLVDTLGVWGSTSSAYTDGDDTFPARPQREDVRILGFVSNGVIRWINGSVTLLGGYSSPQHGDSHNTTSMTSSAYGTSTTPSAEGTIDIDDLITNASQLALMSLGTAYDGPIGSGSGRVINLTDGAIDVNVMHGGDALPADPWMSAFRVTQDELEQGGEGFEAGLFVIDQKSTSTSKWRHALRHARVWYFGGVYQQAVGVNLTWDGSFITVVFTDVGAPVYADFVDLDEAPVYLVFGSTGLSGRDAPSKVYRLAPHAGTSTLRVYTTNLVATIPVTYPNDFGPMASTLSTTVTVYVAGAEIGGFTNYLQGDLRVGRNTDLKGKLNVAGVVVAEDTVNAKSELQAGYDGVEHALVTTTTETTLTKPLMMDGAAIISDANITTSANVIGTVVETSSRGTFSYTAPFSIIRTIPISIVSLGAWLIDWGTYRIYKTDTASTSSLLLSFVAVKGYEITGIRMRIQVHNNISPYSFVVRLIKLTQGSIGSLSTVTVVETYILGTTAPVVGSILSPEDIVWNLGAPLKVNDGDSFFLDIVADNISLSPRITYNALVKTVDH